MRQKKEVGICKKFKGKKVLVWGDMILDEYIYTSSQRTSREAPVLITEFESNIFKPGGAGNVVMNLKSMGAVPIPVAFAGKNSSGNELTDLLHLSRIDTSGIIKIDNFKTPKKSRILSGSENTRKQQILRIDTLNSSDINDYSYNRIEKKLISLIPFCDIIVISDYLKESVKPEIFLSLSKSFPEKIFILDSRYNLPEFSGISYITPNEPEIKKLFPTGRFRDEKDFFEAGGKLLNKLKCKGVILKRGHKGMITFENGKGPMIIPIHGSSDIVDVTGAGDTVIAILSLALSAKLSLTESAKLANVGASLVVMKEGAYPLKTEELERELSNGN